MKWKLSNLTILMSLLKLLPSCLAHTVSTNPPWMAVLYATAKDLLNKSGTLLRGMEDPEDNGWYIPDFLLYGCLAGKSKQQRMDDFSEQEMEETADEIVVLWNKDSKIAARGITISFVDIGNSFCGFTLEARCCLTRPCPPQ